MPTIDTVMDDRPEFINDDKKFRFIKFVQPDTLLAWEEIGKKYEDAEFACKRLDLNTLDLNVIKELGIWEKLTPEQQNSLEHRIIIEKEETKEHMKLMRDSRRAKYRDVPRELTCISCNVIKKISPGALVKIVDNLISKGQMINVQDYASKWKCSKCNPQRKGRASNPNLPPKVELVCKCGFKVSYPASVVAKTLERKGISLEDYVNKYECKKCNPPLRGRKKSSVSSKIELICTRGCGKKIVYPSSVISKTAGKKGMSVEEYKNSYVCQNCENTRGRKKKN